MGNYNKNTFSFDAESNGLWGEIFAIGAVIRQNGRPLNSFFARCKIKGKIDPWVKENIISYLGGMMEYQSYKKILQSFSCFYNYYHQHADIVVHMGYIVEAKLLRDMHDFGFIGDQDGPYPLHDVATALQMAGEDSTSVDSYAKKYNINLPSGSPHNPLYDADVTARVWERLHGNLDVSKCRCGGVGATYQYFTSYATYPLPYDRRLVSVCPKCGAT